MNLVTIEQARAHCRADPEDDPLVTVYVNAAEQSAQDFLDRFVYADVDALAAARAEVPAAIDTAYNAWTAAVVAAADLETEPAEVATRGARKAWTDAVDTARKTNEGMVVNDAIRAAVLMTAAHLYRNREEVVTGQGAAAVQVPQGAQDMLWRHRLVGV